MIAATAEEESHKMTSVEEYSFKMISRMEEATDASMPTETREGALKMVAEVPNKLDMAAGDISVFGCE